MDGGPAGPPGPAVVTTVRARIHDDAAVGLVAAYRRLLETATPPGLRDTMLLRDGDDWQIVTVWGSRADLDRMRASTETPAAVRAFQDVGAQPTVTISEVVAELRGV